MRTATIRDLRNHFAKISAWLDQGEEVLITKRGKSFATIRPVKHGKSQPVRRGRLKAIYGDKVFENPILQERAAAKW